MEYSPTGLKLLLLDSQLLHCVTVQDVDAAAAIYQDSGETSCSSLSSKGGIQHQGVRTRRRHYFRVVSSAPTDRLLGAVHELWGFSGYGIHLSGLLAPAAPVIGHTGENNICSVLFWEFILNGAECWAGHRLLRRRRRLASRRRR